MFAVETRNLSKQYPVGFWRRKRSALSDLNLRVECGEIFGLLGPNGAGKSTTLKTLLRLTFPTSGTGRILGRPLDDISVHSRIGYLPENPPFYGHLSVAEFLNYAGELFGLQGSVLRRRRNGLVDQLGLSDFADLEVRKLSKGMLQTLGVAQALINDPQVIFLDEPMSGLDPIGRHKMRDLFLELRSRGKTVFFSTHILSDAEVLCDRVAILNNGRLQGCGDVRRLLQLEYSTTEILLEDAPSDLLDELGQCHSVSRSGGMVRIEILPEGDVRRCIESALRSNTKIVSLNPIKRSLEDYFLSQIGTSPRDANTRLDNGTSGQSNSAIDAREEVVGSLGSRSWGTAPRRFQSGDTARSDAARPQVAIGTQIFEGKQTDRSSPVPAPSVSPRFPLLVYSSLGRLVSIARHTFQESLRGNVLYSLLVFALVLIGAAVLFGTISVGIEQIILVNLGLSSMALIGLAMAVLIGVSLVSREIETRSIGTLLSKPVRRPEFILGKYLGLLLTVILSTGLMTAGLYLAILFQKRSLSPTDLAPLGAIYLILLQLALAGGLALFFSCVSSSLLASVYTVAVYIVGNFLADMRSFGQQSGSALLKRTTEALYYVLPKFSDLNVIASAAHGEHAPGYLLVGNSFYVLLYLCILLSAAILAFEEREFG